MKTEKSFLGLLLLFILTAGCFDFFLLYQNTTLSVSQVYVSNAAQFANKFLFAVYVAFPIVALYYVLTSFIEPPDWTVASFLSLGLWTYATGFLFSFVKIRYFAGVPYGNLNLMLYFSLIAAGTLLVSVGLVWLWKYGVVRKLTWLVCVLLLLMIGVSPYFVGQTVLPDRNLADSSESMPNVVFMLVDTLNTRHLDMHGYERATAPTLKKFAENNTWYKNFFSVASWTKPAVATLFTGEYPPVHGTQTVPARLPRDFLTMAEIFHSQGYQTAGFSAHPIVSTRGGFAQGFQTFEQMKSLGVLEDGQFFRIMTKLPLGSKLMINSIYKRDQDDAGDLNREAQDWFRTGYQPDRPFFMYLHYMDVHDPYNPPENHLEDRPVPEKPFSEYFDQYLSKQWWPSWKKIYPFDRREAPPDDVLRDVIYHYDSEIRYWDEEFKKFIDFLKENGVYGNTVIVVTSDHGEEFYEHDNFQHGHSHFNELLHVPLVIKMSSDDSSSREITRPESLISLRDRVFDLANISSPVRTSAESDTSSLVFASEQRNVIKFTSVIDTPLKVMRIQEKDNVAWRMYDIVRDPLERNNLTDERPEEFNRLRERLMEWDEEMENKKPETSQNENLSPAMRRELEGLGYVN